MKNKEHCKIRSTEFLLKSWSGDTYFKINLRGGQNSIKYMRLPDTLSPQVITDPSPSFSLVFYHRDLTKVAKVETTNPFVIEKYRAFQICKYH